MQLKTLLNRCPVLWENVKGKPVIDSSSGWSDVTTSTMGKWFSGFLKETGFEILNAHILANVAALRLVPPFSHNPSQFSDLQRGYDREMLLSGNGKPERCDYRLHNRINQCRLNSQYGCRSVGGIRSLVRNTGLTYFTIWQAMAKSVSFLCWMAT